jgi:TctA family transporter
VVSEQIAQALSRVLLDPTVMGVILLSAVYGVFVGAIPGLTATMAVALLVPVTYYLGPVHALAAVVTLEACAIFAGDIPSAIVRMPGTPSSAAYVDDLYAVARREGVSRAMGASLVFSVAGGLFGVGVVILLAQPLARLATSFAYAEYFWFYLIGLSCAVVVSRGSALRGAFALLLGLLFSTVGMSAAHSEPRFTLGRDELLQGINFIPAMIGLFGLSEVLRNMLYGTREGEVVPSDGAPAPGASFIERLVRRPWSSVFGGTLGMLWRRKAHAWRSATVGAVVGILPGAGADIAAWVAYGLSRRFSRKPEEYGRGAIDGVTDASTANNAALGGAWVPTLVFGIPGDSITAIVIGIMMMKGLRPGADIFKSQAVTVYSLYTVFILANLILIPLGFLAIKAGALLVRVPRRILLPIILLFCVLGAFAIQGQAFDVWVMLGFGLLGFALERWGIPLGPVVLGIVLGGPLEEAFVQTLTASKGSLGAFLGGPLTVGLGAVAIGLWLSPLARLFRKKASKLSGPNEL